VTGSYCFMHGAHPCEGWGKIRLRRQRVIVLLYSPACTSSSAEVTHIKVKYLVIWVQSCEEIFYGRT
jgi:hypothetical protein